MNLGNADKNSFLPNGWRIEAAPKYNGGTA
jgi:hypothetical protein